MEELQQSANSRHHQEKEEISRRSSGNSRTRYTFVTQRLVAVEGHDTRNIPRYDELNNL